MKHNKHSKEYCTQKALETSLEIQDLAVVYVEDYTPDGNTVYNYIREDAFSGNFEDIVMVFDNGVVVEIDDYLDSVSEENLKNSTLINDWLNSDDSDSIIGIDDENDGELE